MSVNNKDIIQIYLGYNLFISQKTAPINASFVKSKQWLLIMKFTVGLVFQIVKLKEIVRKIVVKFSTRLTRL